MKAAIDIMQMSGCGYIPVNPYLEKQVVGQIWPLGHSLLTSGLRFYLSFIDCMVWSTTGIVSDLKQNRTRLRPILKVGWNGEEPPVFSGNFSKLGV